MFFKLEQLLNVALSIVVIPSGILIDIKDEQLWNAQLPIVFSEPLSGSFTVDSLVLEKAYSPMDCKEQFSANDTDLRPEPLNTLLPMVCSEAGRDMDGNEEH